MAKKKRMPNETLAIHQALESITQSPTEKKILGLENEIDELKKQMAVRDNRIKLFREKLQKYQEATKSHVINEWEKLPAWKIFPLENAQFSYYAVAVHPKTYKLIEFTIPKEFNPHHIYDMKKGKKNYFFTYRVSGEEKKIDLPLSLYDKLKDTIPEPDDTPTLDFLMNYAKVPREITQEMRDVMQVLTWASEKGMGLGFRAIYNKSGVNKSIASKHLRYFQTEGWIIKEELKYKLNEFDQP